MNEDSTTTPSKPERRDAAENRQRILNAALQLFEQHGVEQVSMNQIAAEAQIGPGTLYRRYRNKSELCLDLMKDNLVILFEDIYAYLEDNHADSPSSRLKGILGLFIKFREKKSQLLRGVEDSSQANRPSTRQKGPLYHELHEILVQLFDEMLAASGKSEPNSVFRADMLLNGVSSESYLFQREVRGYSPEVILEHLCATFIADK
ncbi:TetR/AcrR family transcriptional regulator [Paenibacillus glycanilyticus]|uniref:TetR/AcrR family transcriptional regulator n=1 Tax=Paenibacillus glycanilyticus TaxID=126569 RepID=UPI000FDB32B7|nr:TetR/AcrR family transcriptional regulator [Paenibacillus glycanilyticus]